MICVKYILDQSVTWVNELVKPDKKHIKYLSQPLLAIDKFLSESLERPENVTDQDWNNHLFVIHGVCFDLYALSTKGEKSFLDVFETFALKYWEKLLSKDAIKRTCKVCNKGFHITSARVKWFKDKTQSLPKRCDDCLKSRDRNNENRSGPRMGNVSSTRIATTPLPKVDEVLIPYSVRQSKFKAC